MPTNPLPLKAIVEAALLNAGQALGIDRLLALFSDEERPEPEAVKSVLEELAADWEGRSLELRQVAGGYRFQVRAELAPWIGRLSEERQPRYSRALLETLALIVYRQPITRAGIEEIRGVTVSSHIIRTLLEREWIRVVGHRDVPGRPALFGTTKKFLDYFNLRSLSELPPLAEIRPLDHLQEAFEFDASQSAANAGSAVDEEGGIDAADAPVEDDVVAAETAELTTEEGGDAEVVAADADGDAGAGTDADVADDAQAADGTADDGAQEGAGRQAAEAAL
jgi:segregation and condensation protein B